MTKLKENKKIIGISISDFSLEVVLAEKQGENFRIVDKKRSILEAGVVVDGLAINQPVLANYLKEIFKNLKQADPKKDEIVFAVPEILTYLMVFYEKDETYIEERIKEECEKNIPLDPKKIEIDTRVFFNRSEKYYRVLLAAILSEDKNIWQQFFKRLGYNIKYYDIEVLANFRSIFSSFPKENTALLDIGARTANLTIYNSNGLSYSYSIPYAGDYFSDKLSKALKLEWEEAEKIKKEFGLDKQKNIEAGVVLRSAMEHYTIEIKRNLDFYQEYISRDKSGVKKIYLLGGSSLMPGIKEFFQSKLDVEFVDLGEEHKDLLFINAEGLIKKVSEKKWRDIDPDFSNSVKQKIKLINKDIISKKIKEHIKIAGAALLAVITVVFAFQAVLSVINNKPVEEPQQADLPIVSTSSPEKEEPEAELKNYAVIKQINTNLNIRSGSGTSFSIVGQAPPGEKYEILETGDAWVKILFDNQEAWAYKEFLDIIEE
jgi:type IV pilus assembly protein PilM